MTRIASAVLVAVLLAGSLAEAQRFRGGGRGRFGSESGAPPRFATEADFDGKFHMCRLMYQQVRQQNLGMGWGTDYPYAEINLSIRLSEGPTPLSVGPLRPPLVAARRPGGDSQAAPSCLSPL